MRVNAREGDCWFGSAEIKKWAGKDVGSFLGGCQCTHRIMTRFKEDLYIYIYVCVCVCV